MGFARSIWGLPNSIYLAREVFAVLTCVKLVLGFLVWLKFASVSANPEGVGVPNF